jgi:3-hydroxyisobutyrate dehydrogenase
VLYLYKKRTMRAFIGMGLLGANFVKALRKKGEQVQVWNRTTAKATALEAEGAKAFADVADAVKGADIIHVTLKDDASVDEVLAQAAPGLQKGAVIVDHTTITAEGARQRTAAWKAKGFTYLHAPVFMGPSNALAGTGYMMVSGDQAVIDKLTLTLAAMTGKLLNLGAEEGKAAGMKLVGNLFLVTMTAGLADTLTLAKALNIPIPDVADLFDQWNPGNMLPMRLQRMSSGKYDNPSWELNMARKDTGLFLQTAEQAGAQLAIVPAIAALMDHWIAKGHGNEDWVVIGKDAL